MKSARGVVVALGGPDGAGKSTLADRLTDGPLAGRPVLRIHHRPGVLPMRTSGDAANPHGQGTYGRLKSLAKVAYIWLDHLLGRYLRIRPVVRKGGSVVIERGWEDLIVDARRYRLRVSPHLLRALGKLLPAPDVLVVLEAPAEVLHARKQELPKAELERQATVWRGLAGRKGEIVDASAPEAAVVGRVAALIEASRASAQGWVALPPGSTRWIVPRGPARVAAGALRVYHPVSIRAYLMWRAARALALLGAFRLLPGARLPAGVWDALAPHIQPGEAVAVARTRQPGLYMSVVVDRRGAVRFAANVAIGEEARLVLKSKVLRLEAADARAGDVGRPRVAWADGDVVAYDAVPWLPRFDVTRLPVPVAAAVGAMNADGFFHGDFAPWNLLRTPDSWVLLDWEDSGTSGRPMDDLAYWLAQSYAHYRRPSLRALERAVKGRGRTGAAARAYAEAAGRPVGDLASALLAYTSRSEEGLVGTQREKRKASKLRARLRARAAAWSGVRVSR